MLHVKKVLCLVLAAAVSSVAIEGELFWAKKNYNKAITEAETSIIFKFASMTQNLKSEAGKASSKFAQMEHRDFHTMLENQMQYDTWEAAMSDQLYSILNETVERFRNMRNEVETYVGMYKRNRIPEDEAVKFIKENKLQLPKIVRSAMSKFDALGALIKRGPA